MASKLITGLGMVAGAGALCFGWGLVEANALFTLRRFTVPVLPPTAQPMTVLHVSDIHLMPYQRLKRSWLSKLAELQPDLVVSTGDNISADSSLDMFLDAMGPLMDVPGVYVFGSNDYIGPYLKHPLVYFGKNSSHSSAGGLLDSVAVQDALDNAGWRNVMGLRTQLEIKGLRLEFRGTHDYHLGIHDYDHVAGPASDGVDVSIGVTHAPYRAVLDPMADDGCAVIFAGHTHGGQVCVPGYGALVTNCDLPTKQAKGLFEHLTPQACCWVHVSAGLGTSPFAPYRFACRPEATLLTLIPGPVHSSSS